MRLSEFEQKSIASSIAKHVPPSYELFLYGSRTDDSKKGGDIDLFVLLQNASDKTAAERSKIKILLDIKNKIGEQKIDLSFFERSQLEHEPFLDLVFAGAQKMA